MNKTKKTKRKPLKPPGKKSTVTKIIPEQHEETPAREKTGEANEIKPNNPEHNEHH